MADDLGARLVSAGLVTPDPLSEVRGGAPPHDGALVAALVERGLDEDAVAGFFVALGFGPLLEASELAHAQPEALAKVSGAIAVQLMALPIRASAAGLIVAMAAPTDRHALSELRRVVGGEVLPTVARVSELKRALEAAYPGVAAPPPPKAPPASDPPLLELLEARRKKDLEALEGYLGSTRGVDRVEARALVGPRLAAEEGEVFVPLVRHKPISSTPAPPRARVIPKSFEKPASDAPPAREAVRWGGAADAPPSPRPRASAPGPARSIIPPEHASWEIDLGAPENKVDPQKLRGWTSRPHRPPRPAPIGGTLAAIRASRDRDEVVELACRGALTVSRATVLLALRKGVLKGWDGAGPGVSRDAVRNLWIPTNSPSMFRVVVTRREPYVGPHGTSAADGLFRAALGSRGGSVVLMPVAVTGKVVAVLAADDVRFEREGVERIEILARAVGEALERIIVESKKR